MHAAVADLCRETITRGGQQTRTLFRAAKMILDPVDGMHLLFLLFPINLLRLFQTNHQYSLVFLFIYPYYMTTHLQSMSIHRKKLLKIFFFKYVFLAICIYLYIILILNNRLVLRSSIFI